jgi:uncharacterized damage-inducible protein DinB
MMQTFPTQSSFYLYFLERDLQKMKDEIILYSPFENIWKLDGNIRNSAGNLFLHIMGNLRHFIGATLGNTGYLRNREAEFNTTGLSLDHLMIEYEETLNAIRTGLALLDDNRMKQPFPLEKHGEEVTIEYMLMHLYSHLNYHLGQVNYHRRLLS